MVLRECLVGRVVTLRPPPAGPDQHRLAQLGLVPGARLRVVGRGPAGGMVLAVGDARVAIDARTGGSLAVEPAP